MRILVFGSSIGQGYYDLETGGWVNLLFLNNLKQKVRNTQNTTEVFNISISGNTTKDVMDRLQSDVDSRRWTDEPIILVFAIGFNDTKIINDVPYSTPGKYRTDLETLYSKATAITNHIAFIGLTPVDEAESNPWIFNSGSDDINWNNQRIREFDHTLKDFAQEKAVHHVPILDAFLEQQAQKKLHADGIHPNSEGHKLIFELVRPILDQLISTV
jgi:lysophospholipase L1-like esterase